MNNLQIAIGRIRRGFAFTKSLLRNSCNSVCLRRKKKWKGEENSLDELHKTLGPNGVPNHTIKDFPKNGNGDVTGVDKTGDKYIVSSKSDDSIMSFINNPSLTVTVPIAVGESDFENLNTEDFSSLSSDAAGCKVVRMLSWIGQRCLSTVTVKMSCSFKTYKVCPAKPLMFLTWETTKDFSVGCGSWQSTTVVSAKWRFDHSPLRSSMSVGRGVFPEYPIYHDPLTGRGHIDRKT